MATESTLLIVKPDGVRRGLVGEVLRRVEAKGLTIEEMKLFTIDRATAEEHYGEHREQAVLRRARGLHHRAARWWWPGSAASRPSRCGAR